MELSEVKRALNKRVIYDGVQYVMTGCVIRRDESRGFYHQCELLDENKNAVLLCPLERVDSQ